eukprot:Seg580.2 transcript_id=Seg580.2/GoldUCD/mRNA.D3Y31 product="Diacylglycerol kinase eta" protein_id=Seg580.2/GoldUCD/D3Y31
MNTNKVFAFYREGFLHKHSSKLRLKGYKKRWFVLNRNVLKYYTSQDTCESNVLGVIDMARMVSVSQSKGVKHGFEVTVPSRTYHLSAKTSQERDDWMTAIKNAAAEAKRMSTGVTGQNVSMAMGGTYSTIGTIGSITEDSSVTYDTIAQQPSGGASALLTPEPIYDAVGNSNQEISAKKSSVKYDVPKKPPRVFKEPRVLVDSEATYSAIGDSSRELLESSSTVSSTTYDVIPRRSSEGNITETSNPSDGIYESFDENASTKSASRTTPKTVPLNDNDFDSGSETEAHNGGGGDMAAKMGSLMSALSMESLDSIDSLDLTDDELDDDVTEGTPIRERPGDMDILPKPHGKTYAAEEIKKFLKAEGIGSQKADIGKIAKTFKFDLDKSTEYPAFDALRKFLDVTNLRVDL